MPIREITRCTGLPRNTVRKYLASGRVEPRYPRRRSLSKLDDYEQTLTSWLFRESRRYREQRRSIKHLYHDPVQLGYTGSYDRVAAFDTHFRESQAEAQHAAGKHIFVPFNLRAGRGLVHNREAYGCLDFIKIVLQIQQLKMYYVSTFAWNFR